MTLKKACLDCGATWLYESGEVHRLDCRHHSRKPVRDDWTLPACRERAREMADNPRLSELALVDDRAQLLALVDRMRAYMKHHQWDAERHRCDAFVTNNNWTCTCGLADLLREIDGGGGPDVR